MIMLFTSSLPCWWLLFCKLVDSTTIFVLKDYAFLAIAAAFGIVMLITGYVAVLPALLVAGVMPGALVLVLVLSLFIKQLDNLSGALNFVGFPMFFLSSALYPL